MKTPFQLTICFISADKIYAGKSRNSSERFGTRFPIRAGTWERIFCFSFPLPFCIYYILFVHLYQCLFPQISEINFGEFYLICHRAGKNKIQAHLGIGTGKCLSETAAERRIPPPAFFTLSRRSGAPSHRMKPRRSKSKQGHPEAAVRCASCSSRSRTRRANGLPPASFREYKASSFRN